MTETTKRQKSPFLHLFAGKIASGKSTLARQLSKPDGTVRINEDQWLSALFADEMNSPAHYVARSARLRSAMGQHVVALLQAGLSVVLDFPANTHDYRAWMKDIIAAADCAHELHVLDTPDSVCKSRLGQRNAAGKHKFQVTGEQFDLFSRHYLRPSVGEGFNLIVHS